MRHARVLHPPRWRQSTARNAGKRRLWRAPRRGSRAAAAARRCPPWPRVLPPSCCLLPRTNPPARPAEGETLLMAKQRQGLAPRRLVHCPGLHHGRHAHRPQMQAAEQGRGRECGATRPPLLLHPPAPLPCLRQQRGRLVAPAGRCAGRPGCRSQTALAPGLAAARRPLPAPGGGPAGLCTTDIRWLARMQVRSARCRAWRQPGGRPSNEGDVAVHFPVAPDCTAHPPQPQLLGRPPAGACAPGSPCTQMKTQRNNTIST